MPHIQKVVRYGWHCCHHRWSLTYKTNRGKNGVWNNLHIGLVRPWRSLSSIACWTDKRDFVCIGMQPEPLSLEVCRVHRRGESGSCPCQGYYIRVSNVAVWSSDSDGIGMRAESDSDRFSSFSQYWVDGLDGN
jgi:hypothetical protein